jgi:iron complex transport system substrate-binding protein
MKAEIKAQKKFLLCVLSLTLCAGPVSPIFAAERVPTSPGPRVPGPQRIVSVSPVTTEELFLLDRGNLLVGRTHFCTKPPAALKKEEVGNVLEVSVEKILALRPDLVLAGSMTDPKAKAK